MDLAGTGYHNRGTIGQRSLAGGEVMPVYGNATFSYAVGDSEAFSVRLKEVRLRSGDSVTVKPFGVTAVVGANNVGKSTLLTEIVEFAADAVRRPGSPASRLILGVDLGFDGELEDFHAWLLAHCAYTYNGNNSGFHIPGGGQVYQTEVLQGGFRDMRTYGSLNQLTQFVVRHERAGDRSGHIVPSDGRKGLEAPPATTLQHLDADHSLLGRLNGYFERVFGQTLFLDNFTAQLSLRLGKPGVAAPPADAINADYLRSVAALPGLEAQGDGVKSFAGILLPILTKSQQIILIDEPEAFLHPPQAVALGQILAELAHERKMQVIVATHDRNLLAGLLQAEESDVSVVRLDRTEGFETRAYQLEASTLREMWRDPILRYSNMLDGLFHRLVVLAENDRDCRFYSAALDYAGIQGRLPFPASDVLFVPSAGKSSLPRFAAALRAARVRVVASPDLDILRVERDLRSLSESLGAEWNSIKVDYLEAMKAFQQQRTRTCAEMLGAVHRTLEPRGTNKYTEEIHKEVLDAMRIESLSADLKKIGMDAFLRHRRESVSYSENLLANLEPVGIVPVRVGELENFAPALTEPKSAWLEAAFGAGAHKLPEAQAHIDRILAAYRKLT
jgi:predicted ATPase